MHRGIYTVANDRVANQLISFLNSFKKNWPKHYTICVIPYDANSEKVKEIVRQHDNVVMFDDEIALEKLDIYFADLWMRCPSVVKAWKSKNKHIPHRLGEHRRFIALTEYGLFDQFLYLDVDIYVNKPMSELLDLLEHFDIVAHDYQHTGCDHVFNLSSMTSKRILNGPLEDQVQCTGLIVSKKYLLDNDQWSELRKLVERDHEVLYPWAPDQTLWNYIHNIFELRFVNLVRHWPSEKVTYDSQTYTKFEFKNGKLYQGDREILYFHHIGVPAEEFNRVSEGEEPRHQFRYQDVFKYFRFLDCDTDSNGSRHGKTSQ